MKSRGTFKLQLVVSPKNTTNSDSYENNYTIVIMESDFFKNFSFSPT